MNPECMFPATILSTSKTPCSNWRLVENEFGTKKWQRDDSARKTCEKLEKSFHLPKFSQEEYTTYLTCDNWTLEQTETLLELCEQYELRFVVVQDRLAALGIERSLIDIISRFSDITKILKDKLNRGQRFYFNLKLELEKRKMIEKIQTRDAHARDEQEFLSTQLNYIVSDYSKLSKNRKSVLKLLIGDFYAANDDFAFTTTARAMKKIKKKRTPLSSQDAHQKVGVTLRSKQFSFPKYGSNKDLDKLLETYKIPHKIPLYTKELCEKYNKFKDIAISLIDLRSTLAKLENELKLAKLRAALQEFPVKLRPIQGLPKTAPPGKRKHKQESDSPLKRKKMIPGSTKKNKG